MRLILIILLALVTGKTVFCQSEKPETSPQKPVTSNQNVSGDAAYIFAYYPKENMQDLFEAGYKKHLEWHKEKQDPLVWYAWYIQTGSRLGMFVDGTFGVSHEAFGHRVDPTGDGKDFAQTTAPFVQHVFRRVYELDRSLSTAHLLEDHKPSGAIEVFHITVHPGRESIFEKAMLTLKESAIKKETVPEYTLYKLLSGAEHAGYLMMVPRKGFASFDQQATSVFDIMLQVLQESKASELNKSIAASVKQIESESWGYRADLSLIPHRK